MKVTLVAATQPLIPGITTIDELLAYAARVSNPSNQMNNETTPRLLGYCIRHGHWSVFETASFTVEIETSLAIAMQILRHRSFTFQMFSQRYAEVSKLGQLLEPVTLRAKAIGGNRQGSIEAEQMASPQLDFACAVENVTREYGMLLSEGVAPESARFILPQCTKTRLYMTGNIRSWIHYLAQRLDPHAQKEHREVAEAVRDIFADLCPVTYEACITTEIPAHKVLPS